MSAEVEREMLMQARREARESTLHAFRSWIALNAILGYGSADDEAGVGLLKSLMEMPEVRRQATSIVAERIR